MDGISKPGRKSQTTWARIASHGPEEANWGSVPPSLKKWGCNCKFPVQLSLGCGWCSYRERDMLVKRELDPCGFQKQCLWDEKAAQTWKSSIILVWVLPKTTRPSLTTALWARLSNIMRWDFTMTWSLRQTQFILSLPKLLHLRFSSLMADSCWCHTEESCRIKQQTVSLGPFILTIFWPEDFHADGRGLRGC